MLNSFFNWYFRKAALPYWAVAVFDVMLVFFSVLFVLWLRLPSTVILAKWTVISHTLLVICATNVIGSRVFRTYSGILRYSQFADLMRVLYSGLLALVLFTVFNFMVRYYGWEGTFFPLTGRMTIGAFVGLTTALCASRVLIKTIFDGVLTDKSAERTLIYGTHEGAIALSNEIRSSHPVKFVVCGYIGDSKPHYKERLMGKKIYSTQEDLAAVIRRLRITVLMVSPLKQDMFTNNRELQDIFINAGVKIYISQNATQWMKDANRKNMQMREVKIEDLLPREEIEIDMAGVGALLAGKKVLITGSAGSIGSEMVRQVAVYKPEEMILIDQAETPQHDMLLMMRNEFPDVKSHVVVTSICRADRMEEIFSTFRPDYVFHAAAYKHVPMMEDNPSESVENNVWGTKIIADLSVKYGVRKFVMISTDKAVNPTNVMGCSKRICEIYVQSLDKAIKENRIGGGNTQFVTTRFGNVLGSNGSVIPLFRKQLAAGGPLTVTHPDIIRFFMLIPEACKLVLEAGTHGKGGEIFVFDMGAPVRIVDLARRMIKLSGAKNVEIKFTGLRDGEKLYEEVLSENENTQPSFHKKIRIAKVRSYEYEEVERELEQLYDIAREYDDMKTVAKMKAIVPEYISRHSRYEVLDGCAEA